MIPQSPSGFNNRGFPPKPVQNVTSTDLVNVTTVTPPKQNPIDPKKQLLADETQLILRRCLRHEHASDPNIIKFIAEYLLCRDVKQAAVACGLTKRDGENIKRRPDVYEAIRQISMKAALKHGFDAADVVAKVKEIMDVDIAEFQNSDGSWVEAIAQIAPETRRAVKSFKVKNEYGLDPNGMPVVTGKIISVELWDKMKATELLGREKNLFKESKKVTHSISKNMSNTLLESKRLGDEAAASVRDVGQGSGSDTDTE